MVADIGPDATRILSLMSSLDQAATFDLATVREQSVENPVFYVQMASARIGGVGRKAVERGVVRAPLDEVDLSLLTHPRELELIRCLEELPEVVADAAVDRAPTKVTTWVRRLASCFHGFYHDCPILADDVDPAWPRPGCGWSRRPGSAWPSGSVCSACPPRRPCEPGVARRAHPADRSTAGAAADDRDRSAPTAGCPSGAVDLLDLADELRHPAVRLRRGPPAGRAAARRSRRGVTVWPTPPRPSCAWPWPAWPTRRGCASTSPPGASSTWP